MVLGFGKRGPDSVGCYGKLPLHGDYLSHASDGAEARRLTAWLDAGYRQTRGSDSLEAAGTGFILPHFGRRVLFGGLWPSGNSSGTRRFPFALFTSSPLKPISQLGPLSPLALVRFWDGMIAAMPSLKAAATVDGLTTQLTSITIPPLPTVEETEAEFERASQVPALIDRAKPVLFDVVRLTEALGGGKKPPAFAIRIPLKTQYSAAAETVAWLKILRERMKAPDLIADSHLFIRPPKGHDHGELFVIHRELKPDDLGFVLSPNDDYPYGNCLDGEETGDVVDAFVSRFDKRVEANATLEDLVRIGCGDI